MWAFFFARFLPGHLQYSLSRTHSASDGQRPLLIAQFEILKFRYVVDCGSGSLPVLREGRLKSSLQAVARVFHACGVPGSGLNGLRFKEAISRGSVVNGWRWEVRYDRFMDLPFDKGIVISEDQ